MLYVVLRMPRWARAVRYWSDSLPDLCAIEALVGLPCSLSAYA